MKNSLSNHWETRILNKSLDLGHGLRIEVIVAKTCSSKSLFLLAIVANILVISLASTTSCSGSSSSDLRNVTTHQKLEGNIRNSMSSVQGLNTHIPSLA